MPSFDMREEVFFDSADYLSSEESVVSNEDSWVYANCGYDVWMNEPRSVKERRKTFFRNMGFVDNGSKQMGFERIVESCGAASSSSCSDFKNLVFDERESNGEANCLVDEFVPNRDADCKNGLKNPEIRSCFEEIKDHGKFKKTTRRLWKRLFKKTKKSRFSKSCEVGETQKVNHRMQVDHRKKMCTELTAVFSGQEIRGAHLGQIWTMKFSPDGRFLASGGEDGVVRIWRVLQADSSCKIGNADCFFDNGSGGKKSNHCTIVIPDSVFQLDESPLNEFRGHTGNILDLCWSESNYLISSSEDKTVRLWRVGRDECLNIFHHNNYVTCIQFNPIDENYFISGSIDGKVRIWGLRERRVVDWVDARDVVTAICYQTNGKGFIVGTITGNCRFYDSSGNELQLNAEININGRKKSSSNKITGIQISPENVYRVMVTSEDSKVRILDGIEIVHKYRGLQKSGSQTSASFTPTGRHIVSVGNDSRVYLWNYNDLFISSAKSTRSVRSCEYFISEGLSVAVPWLGRTLTNGEEKVGFRVREGRESERFSLGNWFSREGSRRGSMTWPEEKLPIWDEEEHRPDCGGGARVWSETWGLVIVTGGRDGTIRTFQNYGLPARQV